MAMNESGTAHHGHGLLSGKPAAGARPGPEGLSRRLSGPVLRVVVATLLIAAMLAGAGVALAVYFGLYNVAATKPHWQPAYWFFQTAALQSIDRRAKNIAVPDLSSPQSIARGLALFHKECVRCHGAPGVAPEDFAKGLEPAAPPLSQTARVWKLENMYWAIRHGIKMTAMPAWEFRMSDDDIWSIVAFLRVLPDLSPDAYRQMAAQQRDAPVGATRSGPASTDADRGRIALHQYACNMCHEIPGVSGPPAHAGPPLHGLKERVYVAGVLLNNPANMILWIRHPQSVNPRTAMPELGVTEEDARDMAAYLYRLRRP
jgi:mono/diheme cytochrome c family protein